MKSCYINPRVKYLQVKNMSMRKLGNNAYAGTQSYTCIDLCTNFCDVSRAAK